MQEAGKTGGAAGDGRPTRKGRSYIVCALLFAPWRLCVRPIFLKRRRRRPHFVPDGEGPSIQIRHPPVRPGTGGVGRHRGALQVGAVENMGLQVLSGSFIAAPFIVGIQEVVQPRPNPVGAGLHLADDQILAAR